MKKGILIALDVLLFLAGFPLLILLVYFNSTAGLEASYGSGFFDGFNGLFPIVFTAIMFVIALIAEIILRVSAKRTIGSGKSSFRKQAVKLAVVGFAVLTGLFVVIDCVIAPILTDATSDTLKYEDLVDDYDAQHIRNDDLIDFFIEINYSEHEYDATFDAGDSITRQHIKILLQSCFESDYADDGKVMLGTGDLNKLSLNEYLEQGLKNKEVAELVSVKYKSIDSAYSRFDKIAIDMALKGIMTGEVIGKLIVPLTLPEDGYEVYFPMENNQYMTEGDDYIDLDGDGKYSEEEQFIKWSILDMLGNSDVGLGISLPVTNLQRGVWDYQLQAWLGSVGLLGIITGLFSVRQLFYIFGGVLVITSILRGLCREGYSKIGKEEEAAAPQQE